MAALRARIDAGGSRLQILDSKIGPVSDKLPPIKKRIEAIEANLRDFDRQIKAEIEVDVDVYNAHVYNRKELLKQYEALLASVSDEMAEYLVVLRQTNELVDQYNALVAQYNAPLK
jgi:uncharacterized protein involved in exopolysaccharide biosynthesis